MKTPKTFGKLHCEPLTCHIGAEITGIDFSKDLTDENLKNINNALLEYQVIFFRNQDMSSDNHKRLALYFGDPDIHPAYPHVENYPEICVLESTPEKPSKIEEWHTDMTFRSNPPLGSFLRAWEIPPVGGDTMWGSCTAAYDALSDEMKQRLSTLTAVHDFKHGFKESIAEKGIAAFADIIAKNPPVEHPVIRTHPETGKKGLFVNPLFTSHIAGIPREESDELLEFLYEHQIQDEFLVRFRWGKNSVAIWDNRCTIHKPVNDYFPQYRQLRRITIHGDRPR